MPPQPKPPIDPEQSPTFALAGRVVTMDATCRVIDNGVVYIKDARIADVRSASDPPPAGFETVNPFQTRGTIYPGLIELHNHLSYNALCLWDVPKLYTNRDQWAQGDVYRGLITGPMKVLAHTERYVWAVVRYVESKCLLGGTTTSQGIALSSKAGIQHYYRGVVRNVEQTHDPKLPQAATRIPDVAAKNWDSFDKRLGQFRCLLLHLSEGVDEAAHDHFVSLRRADGKWAIRSSLTGIHCVALQPADFELLASKEASMVWSPLSNLLLYGATADIRSAKASGLKIALGSDWSPSGSKNLLGELKVARLASQATGGVFTDCELVLAATRTAAEILHWENELGSIERGKLADVIVVRGKSGDPYDRLLHTSESEIGLVVINGTSRYGATTWMRALLDQPTIAACEPITVGSRAQLLNLHQASADPDVATLKFVDAAGLLTDALHRLPELVKALEVAPQGMMAPPDPGQVFLVLDHEDLPGEDLRPHLPDASGQPTGELPKPLLTATMTPLSKLLTPLTLDAATVADDADFVDRVAAQRNLPPAIKAAIPAAF